jgi:phosphoribosylformylglycinamidine cyclo-ligase
MSGSVAMSDAYAAAGVDLGQSDAAVAAIVARLGRIELGRPSRSVLRGGHYASVLRITDELGVALTTDGVGSKLVVAEQADRLETVGIDCVAMNVNDLICVGAEPIAMLDYLAVEASDPERLGRIAEGLRVGAQAAGIEIPGGELAVLPELIRGHPSPRGFDLCGAAFGTVALDAMVTGEEISVGDALVGVPSTGLHSNGYTLARRALLSDGGLGLDDRPVELGGASLADALLEPTAIYVRAVSELLASDVPVHGLAHITGGGLDNLKRLHDGVAYRLEEALPIPPIFGLVQRLGDVPDEEMWRVFNMGCGFIAVVPAGAADDAAALLARHHPGARRIGSVVAAGSG